MTSATGEAFLVFLSVERLRNAAAGRGGGHPGAVGRVRVTGRAEDIPGKCTLRVEPGERLIFDTPGGGGFGDPALRDRAALASDIACGYVSGEAARRDSGGTP